jgi:N utilization substance protein B
MAQANSRHRMREMAMQVLFLWDTQGSADEQAARQVTHDASDDVALRQQAVEMAGAAWEQRDAADRWVGRLAPQWPPNRQPGVDRAILRLAVWEMINTATPPKVVLDEAIELAKSYSTELSARFVNGVLDAVLREHKALTAGTPLVIERGIEEVMTNEPMPNDQGMTKDQ